MKTIFNKKSLGDMSLFLLGILAMQGFYAISRFMIGGIVVTYLWLPGVFCIAQLSQMSKKFRLGAFVVLSVILVCTLLYYCTLESSNHIDRDEYQFDSYTAPVQWFLEVNNGDLAVSDELTKNFFILKSFKDSIGHRTFGLAYYARSQQYRILPTEDAQVLVQLSKGTLEKKYYVLNQKWSGMSLQNWIIVKSWSYSNEQINGNDQINKIYDVPLLSIYYPP